MKPDMQITYSGVDITEYVEREDVQRAIAEAGDVAIVGPVTVVVRRPTDEELAEIGRLYDGAKFQREDGNRA